MRHEQVHRRPMDSYCRYRVDKAIKQQSQVLLVLFTDRIIHRMQSRDEHSVGLTMRCRFPSGSREIAHVLPAASVQLVVVQTHVYE